MKQVLEICTTECPFYSPTGSIHTHKEGTPPGPTFANYYMYELENSVLNTLSNKPIVYTRYVDDCFAITDNITQLDQLKSNLEDNSALKFTTQLEINKKLSFLDVQLDRKINNLHTSVHREATNTGDYLNYNSICPDKYKHAVIQTFLYRAFTATCSWQSFHREVQAIK